MTTIEPTATEPPRPPCGRHADTATRGACSRCGDFLCERCEDESRVALLCPGCALRQPEPDVPAETSWAVGALFARTAGLAGRFAGRGSLLHLVPAPYLLLVLLGPAFDTRMRAMILSALPVALGIGALLVLALLFHAWVEVVLARLLGDHLFGRRASVAAVAASSLAAVPRLVGTELLRAALVFWAPASLLMVLGDLPQERHAVLCFLIALLVSAVVALHLSLAVPVVALEGLSGFAALRRSITLVRSRALEIGSFFLAGAFVTTLFILPFGAMGFFAVPAPAKGPVILACFAPFGFVLTCLTTTLYFGVRGIEARKRRDANPSS